MNPSFTAAADRSLQLAARIANAEQLGAILPKHLLWGLLLAESRAAELLARQGVAHAELARRHPLPDGFAPGAGVASAVSPESNDPLAGASISADLRQVISSAHDLAHQLGSSGEVGSEHLLWGLLEVVEPLRLYFESCGLDADSLRAELAAESAQERSAIPVDVALVVRERDAADEHDACRIVDAAANRVREGLRVIEDYLRFGLDDPHLTGLLKAWRHNFTRCLSLLDGAQLLAARDTRHDVGTEIHTVAEMRRESLLDVARANLKRIQEAARTLEEYGKVLSPDFAAQVVPLRYELYTLEKGILRTQAARQRLAGRELYLLVTEAACNRGPGPTIRAALAGGVGIVQLREKKLSDRRIVELGRLVRKWTREADALFIMNDRPDLALLTSADGVHVGQDELTVRDARRIVGPDKLVGVSTHTLEQARQAVLDGADYIGVGPVFSSQTKSFEMLAGLDFVRTVAAEITLPAFAIGGINLENVEHVCHAGAKGIAVSNAICAAENPETVASELLNRLHTAHSAKS